MPVNPNTQTHVVIVTNGQGKIWVVGTDTKRNFTEAGAKTALARIQGIIPNHWDAWEHELAPITEVLASRRR